MLQLPTSISISGIFDDVLIINALISFDSAGDHLVVKQKMVPREVFGGLAKQDSEGEEEENQ